MQVSNIEWTRPNRNEFPSNIYITSTKIDENLIVVTDDKYEDEDWQSKSSKSSNNHQFSGYQPVTVINNYSTLTSHLNSVKPF
jgi:hypothetical protein